VPSLTGTGATLLNGGYIYFSHNKYYEKYEYPGLLMTLMTLAQLTPL